MDNSKRVEHLSELMTKYSRSFELKGDSTSGPNILKLAAFVNIESPSQYEAFRVNDNRTIIFWNP